MRKLFVPTSEHADPWLVSSFPASIGNEIRRGVPVHGLFRSQGHLPERLVCRPSAHFNGFSSRSRDSSDMQVIHSLFGFLLGTLKGRKLSFIVAP